MAWRAGRLTDARRSTADDSVDQLLASMAADAAATIDLPHVVYIQDPYLAHPSAYGPFASPVTAAAFADRFIGELLYDGYTDPVLVQVLPLEAA